jgi:Tfp pilus assembly protein PilN
VIKTNLATRPFYNERAVHAWIAVLALLVVAATIFNVNRVLRYSSSDTRLATAAARDEQRAAELRAAAVQLRASVDPKQVDVASAEARQANTLIDRRTFSWTELFNRFERTLPENVRITAVRPKVDPKLGIVLTMAIVAKSVDDVSLFMENLERTGAFEDLLSTEEHFNDNGLLEASLTSVYVPTAAGVEPTGSEPR